MSCWDSLTWITSLESGDSSCIVGLVGDRVIKVGARDRID